MWRLCVLCIGAASASMIQLRDKEFNDEDKQLTRLLKERMQGGDSGAFAAKLDEKTKKYFEENLQYTVHMMEMAGLNEEDEDEDVGGNETRRQANKPVLNPQLIKRLMEKTQDRKNGSLAVGLEVHKDKAPLRQKTKEFPREPEVRELKTRTKEMMQQQIYATQYRLRDLQRVVDKYSGDLNYRAAFIFSRLETILYEMYVTYTYMHKTIGSNKAHIHMIYYTYFLKKNHDVTYIVEHMIRLHTDYMDSLMNKTAALLDGLVDQKKHSKKGGSSPALPPNASGSTSKAPAMGKAAGDAPLEAQNNPEQ